MASVSVQTAGNISVGDKVQIRGGGIDVTNGLKAKAGSMYGEGGPLWATVVGIYENWPTGSRYGLSATVTKVRCAGSNGSTIVWQVQPSDIADNIIKANAPVTTPDEGNDNTLDYIGYRNDSNNGDLNSGNSMMIQASNTAYAITQQSDSWWSGERSTVKKVDTLPSTAGITTKSVKNSAFQKSGMDPTYVAITPSTEGLGSSVKAATGIKKATYPTAWSDTTKRRELLNQDETQIQNAHAYPYKTYQDSSMVNLTQYDYRFIPGDERYGSGPTAHLEDKLMKFRASVGLPVHGNAQIAKSMKYYMYNRFHTPDINRAFSKTVTYVFFTRPDLNILEPSDQSYTAAKQCLNHSESALIWRRHPELFKLLVDRRRCNDENNFNMLLSNQVATFDFEDEQLSTVKAGTSWDDHAITYGDLYTGRGPGEFRCNFNETQDLAVIQLLKLWITYIDNVKRGAWSPSYSLYGGNNSSFVSSHVYSKTLDYAASVYVFKCGPDGEDILYWTKYYGVFPVNTGASALSWDSSSGLDAPPKLNITFAHSGKRDCSPISLIEFNHNAAITGDVSHIPAYNFNLAGTARPFVGTPYIEMDLASPILTNNDVTRTGKRTQIRLKFKQDSKATTDNSPRGDAVLFRANLTA